MHCECHLGCIVLRRHVDGQGVGAGAAVDAIADCKVKGGIRGTIFVGYGGEPQVVGSNIRRTDHLIDGDHIPGAARIGAVLQGAGCCQGGDGHRRQG